MTWNLNCHNLWSGKEFLNPRRLLLRCWFKVRFIHSLKKSKYLESLNNYDSFLKVLLTSSFNLIFSFEKLLIINHELWLLLNVVPNKSLWELFSTQFCHLPHSNSSFLRNANFGFVSKKEKWIFSSTNSIYMKWNT